MECQLRDSSVYYEEYGEGRPLIMVHGWSLNRKSMIYDMEPLFAHRHGWRRIYPDMPGHGRTHANDWISNDDQVLEVLLNFIDCMIPGQRFVLAGASWGAYLARGVVYHRLPLVDGLLQEVPLIVAEDAKRNLPAHVAIVKNPELVAGLGPDEAEVVNMMAVVQSQKWIDAFRMLVPAGEDCGDLKFQAKIREHTDNYAFSYNVDALPEPCPAPALFMMGRQDSSVGYRDAWEILENYPRGTFAFLDRGGHGLFVEQEELCRALISEWIDRVEEYAESRE